MRKHLLATALIAAAFASGGCYPDRLDSTSYDVIASVHDSTANFSGSTYALRDTVMHLVDPGSAGSINRGSDATILAAIRANMNSRGYTEITGPTAEATADLRLLAAVSSSEWTAYYWSYYCGYYWYSCYYPPYYGTYTYTTGTLFVAMQDPQAPPSGTPPSTPLIWLAIGNGLITGTVTSARITSTVNTMFTQSPYITP